MADEKRGIDDFRKDPASTAEAIVGSDEHGDYITNVKPPQSIADHQSHQHGYDPAKVFDPENAAKRVEGVSRLSSSKAELLEQQADQALAKLQERQQDGQQSEPEQKPEQGNRLLK